MPDDPTLDGHLSLIGEFRQRFPLFERLVGHFGDDCPREQIPWFFGFLLAAATGPKPSACCFVLEKTAGTAPIAALLTAFSRLKSDFPRLIEEYAKHGFRKGQRVRVRPSDFVYEYEGLWPEFSGFFRLKLLGEDARRSFPLVDVLRLEPTDRLRPKGTGACNLGQFASSALDQLLDLSSCGNNSIIRNVVLCHMPRTQFARIVDSVILAPRQEAKFDRLSQFLSWGSIAPDGSLRPNDPHQTVGEPLIAVSGIPEDLARACKDAPPGSKVVFADGPQRFARDLQAYDDIVERQKLIVLASPTEVDDLQQLRDRGCTIWRMSAGELLLGEKAPHSRRRTSLVGGTVRAAEVRRRAHITPISCEDEELEIAARALERVSASLDGSEQCVELEEGVARLFGSLFECSESCFGAPERAWTNLEVSRSIINRNARWLSSDSAADLKEAVDRLASIIRNGSGQSKATALVDLLTEHILSKGELWAVIARSPGTSQRLLSGLKEYGIAPPVTAISSVAFGHEYDGVVLAGWPNDLRFRRLYDQAVAPEISILTYPFEKKWLDRYRIRARQRARMDLVSREQRAEVLQVNASYLADETETDRDIETASQNTEAVQDPAVFQFEARIARRRADATILLAGDSDETRPARFVHFMGGCYAFLTEWAEVPVLNDIVEHGDAGGAKIGTKTVSEFVAGDFLLFRAAGDKEFVRLIAEEIAGSAEYERLREKAERWKTALRRLGSSPSAVQRRLGDFGLERTTVTIGSWLGDPNRIGPGDKGDIEVIAKAARDSELLASIDSVAEAISRVRGTHLSAGMRLTKLILGELRGRVAEIRDEPTLLDLGYGEAWVVQVEAVESHLVECPANKANRLLWVADTGF